MNQADEILIASETILAIMAEHHLDAIVIGAVALAAHHYVRQTRDLDLGVNADLPALRKVVESLKMRGFQAVLREPDGDDPLGGVIDVTGAFGLVQIISYAGRFPAVIDDALRVATLVAREGSSLRIVPIPHLVALKLYAGGHKSKADIVELLARNQDIDFDEVRALCSRYRLGGIDELIAESRLA